LSRIVERDLEALRELGLRMAGLSEAILEKALEAVSRRDGQLAEEVQGDDLAIDRLDIEIDEAVLEILALQAPVARDLRAVIGVKSVATDLERVGDLARNIAKSATRLANRPKVPVPPRLEQLGDESRRQLRLALDAFASADTQAARRVLAGEALVDEHQDTVVRDALEELQSRPEISPQEVDFILIAKSLERVADHATNIAEEVVRIAESRNLKHAEKLAGRAAADE
jgi:phosphate transport system protein